MTDRDSAEELEEEVLQYLREHPHAMDTLRGIAEWWLARRRARVELATLAGVLSRLVDRGVLEEIGSGEYARYRLRQP
jgi:predicted transcriptional regulator